MVIAKVGLEIIKRVVTHGSRLARYDEFAWNKLYTGLPRHVKKGTRHGFIAGSTIGGLLSGVTDLSDDGTGTNNGFPSKRSQPYTKRQTYSGRGRNNYRSKRFGNGFHKGCKCPKCCFRPNRMRTRRNY